MPMRRVWCILLLVVLLLPSRLVQAQASEIITVTAFYIEHPEGEYENVLISCESREVWDVAPDSPAFPTLTQQYTALEKGGQLGKYRELFVEVRGRYSAYEGKSHSDGVFHITEVVRQSTDRVDPALCPLTCEDIYGADSPTCLAQVDGQCGSTRNSCVSGHPFDHAKEGTTDTATHYRWKCWGSYGGDDSEVCTAPKGPLPPDGVCGYDRNTCTTGTANADAVADTATHYRWQCAGGGGSPAVTCTAPKPGTVGHFGSCRDYGPCAAEEGDCDPNRGQCQAGLTCVADVGAKCGFLAGIAICESPGTPPVLRGFMDNVFRLRGPLTLYGWADNQAAPTTPLPIESYRGGPRGSGRWLGSDNTLDIVMRTQ